MATKPVFDDLDLRIMDALAEDGRRPFTPVAEDLGVAEGTVRARVGRLQRLDAICRIPEAVYVIECTATYDVLVEVVAKDSDDLLRLMQEEIRKVAGVAHVDTFMGLRIAKGTFRYTDLGRAGEPRRGS